jgi:hypothetical protein
LTEFELLDQIGALEELQSVDPSGKFFSPLEWKKNNLVHLYSRESLKYEMRCEEDIGLSFKSRK